MVTYLSEPRLSHTDPIGRRVRECREAMGIKQDALARMSGLRRSWISLLELGGIKSPGAARIAKLAAALGVSSDYLMTGRRSGTESLTPGPGKAPILRRLDETYSLDQLSRIERAIAALFLREQADAGSVSDEPSEDETEDKHSG